MRIIGGRAKGVTLYAPKGLFVRPTSDRVKESIFNILSSLDGRSFLDLYAGSGSMGLEALSRGASRVVFVEKTRSCIEAIRRNLVLIRIGLSSEVIGATAEQGIRMLGRRRESFDIVFADPPYEKGYVDKTLDLLRRSALLARPSGVFVLQHSAREEPAGEAVPFVRTRRNRYGETEVSFFQWEG
jgi:16S rRNA (guanine(966)-N(2))-methyltransferase RsmD